MPEPLRVAIVGTSARSDYLYGPLLKAMPEHVTLVAVWGRSVDSARKLGESLAVPWYTAARNGSDMSGGCLAISGLVLSSATSVIMQKKRARCPRATT